jgi:predicted transposase/invertase (TIGR01784 family)
MTNRNLFNINNQDNDETKELIDSLKSFGQGGEYADPTTDTAFKHLLSPAIEENKEIIKSFLNTFVPAFAHDAVKDVREASIAVPPLPKPHLKQTFMDMHVISQSGHHYVIEMQAHRHINFDERVLYYSASTYSQQLSEKELQDPMWYRNLKPTIAIQVLGYDTNRALGIKDKVPDSLIERAKNNPLPDDQFMKHYIMTDKHSGQEIKHLQMIQIELPRARKNIFPPQKDFSLTDWWLSVFKFAPQYTQEAISDLEKQGIVIPSVIAQALERLYFQKWNPKEIHEYKTDTIEKEKYAVEFASERAEGKAEGKVEGKQKGIEEVARNMVAKGMELETISSVTGLSVEELSKL